MSNLAWYTFGLPSLWLITGIFFVRFYSWFLLAFEVVGDFGFSSLQAYIVMLNKSNAFRVVL